MIYVFQECVCEVLYAKAYSGFINQAFNFLLSKEYLIHKFHHCLRINSSMLTGNEETKLGYMQYVSDISTHFS